MNSDRFEKIKNYLETVENFEQELKDIIAGKNPLEKKGISKYTISKLLNYLKQTEKFAKLIEETSKVDDIVLQSLYYLGQLNYCPVCGKPTKSIYCSPACTNHSEEVKDKMRNSLSKTLTERYGEDIKSTSQLESVKEKMRANWKNDPEKAKQTCLERYSDPTYNNPEKAKQTCLERYGVERPLQNDEIHQKVIKTNNERYGCDYPLQNTTILNNTIKTVNERYGFNCVLQNEKIKEQIKQTKLERYDDPYFVNPDKTKQTKLERYNNPNYTNSEKRSQTLLERYGVTSYNYAHFKNFELLNEEYVRNNFIKNDEFLVKEFMDFYNISPAGSKLYKIKFNITEPNKILHGKSNAEVELANWIKDYTEIITRSNIIKPYEIDILIPCIKLAIEYNGSFWHSTEMKDDMNYHLKKTDLCLTQGYQLFHIFDFDDIEIWKSMILNKLNLSEKIYARKCIIKTVSTEIARNFIDSNHIQGFSASSIYLGLYYNDNLVQIMTFGKPRFSENYDFELIRLCTLKGVHIVGGTSKLFKHFVKMHPGKSIISYCNRRFSEGNIYKKLGFEKIKTTKPNYYYVDKKDFNVLSRYQCQKHKLSNLLENFDPNLSESDNMYNNGYLKIYDCGNYVFVYNSK